MFPARLLPVVLLCACFRGGPEVVALPASLPNQATQAAVVAQRHTVTVDGHPIAVHSKRPARARAAVVLVHGRTWSGLPALSCKLPHSSDMALMLPFARPTGDGLGKSGWVSASFTAKEEPPLDLLREWIAESYRAVAPKKLVAALAGGGGAAGKNAASSTRPGAGKVGKQAASKRASK